MHVSACMWVCQSAYTYMKVSRSKAQLTKLSGVVSVNERLA